MTESAIKEFNMMDVCLEDYVNCYHGDYLTTRTGDVVEYQEIEQLPWEDSGKIQCSALVVYIHGNYYMIDLYRSGSHWSGYELDVADVNLVKKELVTTTKWVAM